MDKPEETKSGRVDWELWNKENPAPKEWSRQPCLRCSATTLKQAETLCRPTQLPCGDYECGTPEDAPTYFGFIHGHSDEWNQHSGEFWAVVAYDEGMTNKVPATLKESPSDT